MRLFLAIDLLPDVKDALASAVTRAMAAEVTFWGDRVVNWVRRENLHITLKFLGDIPEPAVPTLVDLLREIPQVDPAQLQTNGLLLFPPRGPVRIIACDVAGAVAPLNRLRAELDRVGEAVGVPRDGRPFHPHITLGRARRDATLERSMVQRFKPLSQLPLQSFTASVWTLYESQLLPTGPVYRAVQRLML